MAKSKRGFEISLDHARNIVKVRIWGFWDVELARKFEKEFKEKVTAVKTSGKDWYILMDLIASLTQSQEVQKIISKGLTFLKDQRPKKRAILADKSIILFQAETLAQDTYPQIYSYFQAEDNAIRWLLNELPYK